MNNNHTMKFREQSSTTSKFRLTMHKPVKVNVGSSNVVRDLNLKHRTTCGPDKGFTQSHGERAEVNVDLRATSIMT